MQKCNQLKNIIIFVYFQYLEVNLIAMECVSEREYSAHSNLSRGAIQKARNSERLVVYGDGSINAATSDARRAEMTGSDPQRRSTGGTFGCDEGFSGPADSSSDLKARTALTVH